MLKGQVILYDSSTEEYTLKVSGNDPIEEVLYAENEDFSIKDIEKVLKNKIIYKVKEVTPIEERNLISLMTAISEFYKKIHIFNLDSNHLSSSMPHSSTTTILVTTGEKPSWSTNADSMSYGGGGQRGGAFKGQDKETRSILRKDLFTVNTYSWDYNDSNNQNYTTFFQSKNKNHEDEKIALKHHPILIDSLNRYNSILKKNKDDILVKNTQVVVKYTQAVVKYTQAVFQDKLEIDIHKKYKLLINNIVNNIREDFLVLSSTNSLVKTEADEFIKHTDFKCINSTIISKLTPQELEVLTPPDFYDSDFEKDFISGNVELHYKYQEEDVIKTKVVSIESSTSLEEEIQKALGFYYIDFEQEKKIHYKHLDIIVKDIFSTLSKRQIYNALMLSVGGDELLRYVIQEYFRVRYNNLSIQHFAPSVSEESYIDGNKLPQTPGQIPGQTPGQTQDLFNSQGSIAPLSPSTSSTTSSTNSPTTSPNKLPQTPGQTPGQTQDPIASSSSTTSSTTSPTTSRPQGIKGSQGSFNPNIAVWAMSFTPESDSKTSPLRRVAVLQEPQQQVKTPFSSFDPRLQLKVQMRRSFFDQRRIKLTPLNNQKEVIDPVALGQLFNQGGGFEGGRRRRAFTRKKRKKV